MEKNIQFRGSHIYYTIKGKGNPVVLLHGFAEDSDIWSELMPALEKENQLIIPDIPGSGRSELLKGNCSMNDYAAVIKAILDSEQLKNVIMIGHSMGGYITLAFAEDHPAMLKAIGLFHSSAYTDDGAKIETRKKAISFIGEKGPEAFLKTSIPGLFKDGEKSRKQIDELLERGRSFKSEALIQYYQAMICRPDRTYILKEAQIPFLLIMGEHDKAVPFQHSLEQAQLPSHSYVYILRESAHMGMLEEKGNSEKILAEFLHDVNR